MYLHQILTSIHNNNNIYHTWDTRRGRNEYQIQMNSKITKTITTGTVTATTRTEEDDDAAELLLLRLVGTNDGLVVGFTDGLVVGFTDGLLVGFIDGLLVGMKPQQRGCGKVLGQVLVG